MCFSGDSNVTTALVYVLMGEILAQEDFRCTKSTFFLHNRTWQFCGILAFPQKTTMRMGTPHWFVELSTPSTGLFGAHVKTQL